MTGPMNHGKDCRVDRIEFPRDEQVEGVEAMVLRISGMGCVNCANRVHNVLAVQDGVVEVVVDHTVGAARLLFDPERMDIRALVRAVTAAGDERHRYQVIA